jgi:hypothetical protein
VDMHKNIGERREILRHPHERGSMSLTVERGGPIIRLLVEGSPGRSNSIR